MKSIINMVYFYFYSMFVKRFFKLIYETDNKENVYRRKNKLVVFVNNKEIGKQIYDIVRNLKNRKDNIYTNNINFKIAKYIVSNGEVQAFTVKCYLKNDWDKISNLVKLQELVQFITDMQKKGYILDESKFEPEKCNNISTFLTLFQLGNKETETTKGYLVKYIHYVLSGGVDFNQFYEKMLDNGLCRISQFPYHLPVIKMCYNYFLTGNVEEDIYFTLEIEKNCNPYSELEYLIANKGSLNSKNTLIESNDEYSIYDENIKIYNNVSIGFEKFLLDYKEELSKSNVESCVEQIGKLIIDFHGNIIGYKFLIKEQDKIDSIFNKTFKSQGEILNFISEMCKYLLYLYNNLDSHIYIGVEEKNDFNIEQALVCFDEKYKVVNIKEVYNLATSDKNDLYNQFTVIFFKLLQTYLLQKYGGMSNEEQFLEKIEVRSLSPIIAKEFINYALDKKVDYELAVEDFFNFLHNRRKYTTNSSNEVIFYDSRFEYDPIQIPFLFENEAESKYGIELKKGITQTLSDGRILVIFRRSKKISNVKDKDKSLRNEIFEKVGNIEDNNVKIVGISEILYSKDINIDNMHNVIGYITTPIKGEQLTDKMLLNLSNRDFIKVAGYLFSKFSRYYIPWERIWMDNNFVFYINILDENFCIQTCKSADSNCSFVNWVTQYFIEAGYNPNAFIEFDFSKRYPYLKEYLIDMANVFEGYCDEHDIYYNNTLNEGFCPVCKKTKFFVPCDFETKNSKILEDEYAVHYRVDKHYNLKVYKKSFADIKKTEDNIDKIISYSINAKKLNLGQKCFIPYKKAFDIKKQFIGYIYEATQFGDYETDINICNDIKDTQTLKNLPRLMSLIRLILQIKEISKRNLGFIKNPFSYVFLSKNHKKQVQILNIEFLTENGSEKGIIKNTRKWTCEYVCEILSLDTSIEVDISDCSTDLDAILLKLQALAKDMTKYCSIHNMYYTKQYLFCPKCLKNCKVNNIEIQEVKKAEITQQKPINEGGESYIYSYNDNLVVKVFKDEVNYDLKGMAIACVLAKKEVLEEFNNKNLKYKYIIPQKILVDKESNKIFGYVMNKISGMPLSSLRDKALVEEKGITMKDVFEILIAVGEGIENLHANNIYIGDLNGRNILFDTEKNVYFLDFDGMGVDDITPEFCTDGYIDPVSKKNQNITMKDDWYSFAVQAFYYLTFTHPFNGIYTVKENGKEVTLDIPDKMERRISLLGNHGMKPPAIARSWDWMNKELKRVFLNTFEKDTRENIVPYLIKQYEKGYIRVNPKFTAKELDLFDEKIEYVINHYSALCKKDSKYFIDILDISNNNQSLAHFICEENINNVLLSDDKRIVFLIFSSEIVIADTKTCDVIYKKEVSKIGDVVVNDNTLYYTAITEEGNIIFKVENIPTERIREEKIKFLPKQQTKRFYAKFNSKFIVIKCATNNVDEVYCNNEKLCDIKCSHKNCKYNIVYDKYGKSWLVVNTEGNGIIINEVNGTYIRFNIEESINDINIENIIFDKRMIYIPNKDCLHIVNTNDQITTKKMECNEIMTPDSKLYDINTEGFSVITNNILYEVRRG